MLCVRLGTLILILIHIRVIDVTFNLASLQRLCGSFTTAVVILMLHSGEAQAGPLVKALLMIMINANLCRIRTAKAVIFLLHQGVRP